MHPARGAGKGSRRHPYKLAVAHAPWPGTLASMHPYPHVYRAMASAGPGGSVAVDSKGVPRLDSAPPPEFDGPGDLWSPETLLVAAMADCFVLTFRAFSRASKFDWNTLECRVEGVLERVEGVTRFSSFATYATLTVPAAADRARAGQLLEKAERGCLISNSVLGARSLETQVLTAP